jgi:hypothetical protein
METMNDGVVSVCCGETEQELGMIEEKARKDNLTFSS